MCVCICVYMYVGMCVGGVCVCVYVYRSIMHLNTDIGTHLQLYPSIPDYLLGALYLKNTKKSSKSRRPILYVNFIFMQMYSVTTAAANPLGYTFPLVTFLQCSRF